MVAIVPRELYELFSPLLALKTVRLPKAIPAITIRQYWHPRIASDPSVKFLRELVYEAAREHAPHTSAIESVTPTSTPA